MKIAITGGHSEADFIISMFKKEKHEIVVINDDLEFAKKISEHNEINVYYGNPTKPHILENACIMDSDILISLCDVDTDNYVICQLGKRMFGVKKCICIVKNPKNVKIFKSLGIQSVISSTYLLYKTIKGESELETLVKTLSIENEKIAISEIVVSSKSAICGSALKDLQLPAKANISCVLKGADVVIPNGATIVEENDKLVVLCKREDLGAVIDYLKNKVSVDDR